VAVDVRLDQYAELLLSVMLANDDADDDDDVGSAVGTDVGEGVVAAAFGSKRNCMLSV
jgi:hypothetical protein